ncbi:MAG: 50S ribosomal protein L11 methyltransferase [Thermodesulfobacteriota bacterium]
MKVELTVPSALCDALANFLTEIGAQGTIQETPEGLPPQDDDGAARREKLTAFLPIDAGAPPGPDRLSTYLASLAELFPHLEKPMALTEVVRDPGWGEAWKKYFKPLRAGRRFIVKPTWEPYAPERGEIVIEIDPGMAFGTGQHASTRLCLEAIEALFAAGGTSAPARVLDLGTGTGILAIACAKCGAPAVLAVDNDPRATAIARENALVNRAEERVTVTDRDIAALTEPFPLVVANLTAGILDGLYPHLRRLVSPGGYLVMSGIIEQNRTEVEARFLGGPFALEQRIAEKEWVCYVLKKAGDGP